MNLRSAVCLVAVVVACPLSASGQTSANKPAQVAPPAEDSPKDNSITLSTGGWFTRGDRAAFQQRSGVREGAFGGIEEFHYERFLTNQSLLSVEGRALFDQHDYRVKLELAHPDRGFVRFGYSEVRTWYDGSGGFFPVNGQFFRLYDERLSLDRGHAWFEAGLTRPDSPLITVRYDYLFRHGLKDSTSWGDSALTGLVPTDRRGIVPSFWDIDEKRHIFAADVKHSPGKSDFGVGLRYELVDNNDARKEHRRPGEASDRRVTQREGVTSDMFNVRAFTETRCNEWLRFTSGYSFTLLDTDISGSRIYGADYDATYDPAFVRRQSNDEGFFGLSGGSRLKQYVMNLSVLATPWENFALVPALRVEKSDNEGFARFTETAVNGALVTVESPTLNTRSRGFVDVTESLEARYTGWRNWVLNARAEWLEGNGTLSERELDPTTLVAALFRDTDSERFTEKYSLGANWYPLRRLNLAAQYYHKRRDNSYSHASDSTGNASGNRYPAYLTDQDFATDDLNLRVTWRPWPNLTLVSRYDFQLSTVDTATDGLASVQSAESTTHIFSQSASWNPLPRWYLQGTLNYTLDRTDTPALNLSGVAANIIQPARNNYWATTLTSGFALTEKTDLLAHYFYYRADNWADNGIAGMPYGAGAEEHGVTASMTHRFTSNLLWTLKYGFLLNRDTTSGGNNNHEAHFVYTSWTIGF